MPNGDLSWIDKAVRKAAQGKYGHMLEYIDLSVTHMEWMQAFLHKHFHSLTDKPLCLLFYRSPEYDTLLHEQATAQGDAIQVLRDRVDALLESAASQAIVAGAIGDIPPSALMPVWEEAKTLVSEIVSTTDDKQEFAKPLTKCGEEIVGVR